MAHKVVEVVEDVIKKIERGTSADTTDLMDLVRTEVEAVMQ